MRGGHKNRRESLKGDDGKPPRSEWKLERRIQDCDGSPTAREGGRH